MSKGSEKKSNEHIYHKQLEALRLPSAEEQAFIREARAPIDWLYQSGRSIQDLPQMRPYMDITNAALKRSQEQRKGTGALQLGGPQNEGYLENLRQLYASQRAADAGGTLENAYNSLYENAMGQLGNAVQMGTQRKLAGLNAATNIYSAQLGKPSMWNSIIQGAAAVGAGAASKSDKRLKFSVKTLPYGLEEVLRLKPVWYIMDGHEQVGFIAQDVEKIMPELVVDIHNDLKGLMYGNMTAVLANAIQELHKELIEARLVKKQGRMRKLLSSLRSWLKSKL